MENGKNRASRGKADVELFKKLLKARRKEIAKARQRESPAAYYQAVLNSIDPLIKSFEQIAKDTPESFLWKITIPFDTNNALMNDYWEALLGITPTALYNVADVCPPVLYECAITDNGIQPPQPIPNTSLIDDIGRTYAALYNVAICFNHDPESPDITAIERWAVTSKGITLDQWSKIVDVCMSAAKALLIPHNWQEDYSLEEYWKWYPVMRSDIIGNPSKTYYRDLGRGLWGWFNFVLSMANEMGSPISCNHGLVQSEPPVPYQTILTDFCQASIMALTQLRQSAGKALDGIKIETQQENNKSRKKRGRKKDPKIKTRNRQIAEYQANNPRKTYKEIGREFNVSAEVARKACNNSYN